jgi:hypothetical protein
MGGVGGGCGVEGLGSAVRSGGFVGWGRSIGEFWFDLGLILWCLVVCFVCFLVLGCLGRKELGAPPDTAGLLPEDDPWYMLI